MTKRIITSAALLFPLFASADTLILRNGTQYRGNFNSANSNQISFTEYNGNRQNLNVSEVQELRFGNDQGNNDNTNSNNNNSNRGNNSGFGRNSNNNLNNNGDINGGSSAMADDLERLQSDLQSAMNNGNLSSDQRQTLDDSHATLRAAAQQSRNGRPVNQRNVRLALDSIRNAADRMGRQDRDLLNEDVRRVSASMGSGTGRDY